MLRFIHIDISADDPERAANFYGEVFGWTVEKLAGPMPYWLIKPNPPPADAPALTAGVAQRRESWQSVTPTIDVPSADEYAGKIEAAGGTIVEPKTLIPGIGYLVSFKDPAGNVFAVLEPVPSNPFADG